LGCDTGAKSAAVHHEAGYQFTISPGVRNRGISLYRNQECKGPGIKGLTK
jgi:hypothetical protein